MDLTKLYNLTTPELRAEAERLGVSDTYALSRAQLIHAIRTQAAGPPPEGFFGRVLGLAKWALATAAPPPEAASSPPKSAPASSPASPPATGQPETAPTTAPAKGGPEVPAPSEEADEREATRRFVRPPGAPSQAPGADPVPTDPGDGARKSSAVRRSSAPISSGPPAGVFSGPGAATFDEPFPTRTMARILADQGHYKRALAIYAHLLQEAPGDMELQREIDEVRSQSRARRSSPPIP
jgi:hypothetical protein